MGENFSTMPEMSTHFIISENCWNYQPIQLAVSHVCLERR